MTPAERKLRARIGGLSLAAQRDPKEYTANARAAFLSRFDDEVDPERALLPEERARRAKAAKAAYFARLRLKSAKTRARKRNNGK